MSGSNYAATQDEIAGILGMSRQQFGKYASRTDAPAKQKSGYNIAKWREYVRSVQSSGLKGDGSLRDEKLLREIQRLDIAIGKDFGDLVNYAEAQAGFIKTLSGYRKAIDSWREHNTAKHPTHAYIIDELASDLITRIRGSSNETN
jgi:hypothetical protein